MRVSVTTLLRHQLDTRQTGWQRYDERISPAASRELSLPRHGGLWACAAVRSCRSVLGTFPRAGSQPVLLAATVQQHNMGRLALLLRQFQRERRDLLGPNFQELDHRILCSIINVHFILQPLQIHRSEELTWECRECYIDTKTTVLLQLSVCRL